MILSIKYNSSEDWYSESSERQNKSISTTFERGPVVIGYNVVFDVVQSVFHGIFRSVAAEGASFSSHMVTALRLRCDLRDVITKIEQMGWF